jgi:hypothetical protein
VTTFDPRNVLAKLRMFGDHSGPDEIALTRAEVQSLRRLVSSLAQACEEKDPGFFPGKYNDLCNEIVAGEL